MTNDSEVEKASAEAHMEFLSLDPGAELQRATPTHYFHFLARCLLVTHEQIYGG